MMMKRALITLLLAMICAHFWAVGGVCAARVPADDKSRIISLVERDLSRALSFAPPRVLPDFSSLDEINPAWDQGKPGEARRKWLEAKWTYFHTKYRVDSVFITSRWTAVVKGVKTIRHAKTVPMLIWASRQQQQEERSRFVLKVYRNAENRWIILKELNY